MDGARPAREVRCVSGRSPASRRAGCRGGLAPALVALAVVALVGCRGTPGGAAPRRSDAGAASDAAVALADAAASPPGSDAGVDAGPRGPDTDGGGRSDAGTGEAPDAGPRADVGVEPEPPLRVVSLNLRCLVDDWPARRPILIDVLAGLDPELFGLQEACAGEGLDNLAELVAGLEARTGLRYTVHRHVTHRAWERFDEGVAIVSALPVLDTGLVRLPGGVFPRVALVADVQTAAGRLGFATTHLDHRDADTRLGQVRALAEALSARWGAAPAVLTGDFNAGPEEASHAPLAAAGLADVWAALRPGEAGPTFPAERPSIRIEYVRVRGRSASAVARILDAPVGGRFGSDHLGLLVELE